MKKNSAATLQFRHDHALGQNFIHDEALLEKLVDVAGVTGDDTVLEIGAGMGTLSRAIARRAGRLVCVELDERLLPFIRLSLEGQENCEVVQGDIMKLPLQSLLSQYENLKVVANLPYYLTTPLMEKLLLSGIAFRSIHVMLQKEAGDRLIAMPGESGYGPLSVLARVMGEPRAALFVPRSAFTPVPKVDSAFIAIDMLAEPRVAEADLADFLRLVRCAFAMKRKTLVNNLMPACALSRGALENMLQRLGFPSTRRAEEMSVQNFSDLLCILRSNTTM